MTAVAGVVWARGQEDLELRLRATAAGPMQVVAGLRIFESAGGTLDLSSICLGARLSDVGRN